MPIPSKKKGEDSNKFMQRCMGNETMKKDFPDNKQRVAVCMSKAIEDLSHVEAMDFQLNYAKKKTEDDMEEEDMEEDDTEEEDATLKTEAKYKYRNPNTNEIYYYNRQGIYKKDGQTLVFMGKEDSKAAQITTKTINNLPDSDFAYIEPGGKKDSEGKTVPRSLRHLPIHDAAHVRNALARLPQTNIPDRKSTRLNSSHIPLSRMPSSA